MSDQPRIVKAAGARLCFLSIRALSSQEEGGVPPIPIVPISDSILNNNMYTSS